MGNGVLAQRQNPEVRVIGPDAMLAAVKERLEHFNQVGFASSTEISKFPYSIFYKS